MKCFNHNDKESIAVCKACGKAVCRECARETEHGIVCQKSCLNSLLETHALQSRQAAHLKNMKRMSHLGAIFSICMGILFIYFSSLGYGLVYELIFYLGVGFTLYGIVAQIVNMFIFLISRKKLTD